MKNLLIKEFVLARHPTTFLFLLLASMLLIPNYPYLVVFFYCCLGVFFICIAGRENKDVEFTLLLPVAKGDVARARVAMAALLEVVQILLCVPFLLLRARLLPDGNAAGMDANPALLGLGFVFFGLFNVVFFPLHYRNVARVGVPFLWGCAVTTLYAVAVEAATHVLPPLQALDRMDRPFAADQLLVLAAGAAAFAVLTLVAGKLSVRRLERADL